MSPAPAALGAGPMVELSGVSRGYGEHKVLDQVSLLVPAGAFVAVLGPSGSGKSTLLHIMGGLDASYTGTVRVAGVDLSAFDDRGRARFRNEKVGFVFQAFNLLPQLSALQNVLLPSAFSRARSAGEQERAREALARVGLLDKAARRPSELSGGERQRVAIARALFTRPPLLCADEPTGNLDAQTGAEVIALFARLNREDGVTVVAVTHEERVSAAASKVYRLFAGKLEAAP